MKKEQTDVETLAHIINSVGGVEPSPQAKKIIHLYATGEIDLDTTKKKLLKEYHS
ncbi:MAG: hypothetical protein J6I84_05405 [Bacilli bacterium]|nr:hypothetical protein [Bacilli bacterium]